MGKMKNAAPWCEECSAPIDHDGLCDDCEPLEAYRETCGYLDSWDDMPALDANGGIWSDG